MKRQSLDSSDQHNSAAKRSTWDHNSTNGNEAFLTRNQNSYSATDLSCGPTTSEHQSVPSTTIQSFQAYSYDNPEYYNNQMSPNPMMHNQMMMYNTMRNFPWPDNSMYPVSMVNNMSMNSTNLPYGSANLPGNNECQAQTLQAESNNAEVGRSQSPVAVPYSDEEAVLLLEKLRNKDTFVSALQTLITWLSKSEFNKSNSTYLFNLVQAAHVNVWKLMNDKASFKEDLNLIKLEVTQKKKGILSQFQEIYKVFQTAKLQKVWDQFTKPQRKQVSTWIEETNETMSALTKELDAENVDPDEDSPEISTSNSESLEASLNGELQEYVECLDSVQNQVIAAEADNSDNRIENERLKLQQDAKMCNVIAGIKDVEEEIETDKSIIAKHKSPSNTKNILKPIANQESRPRFDANSAEMHKNENGSSEDIDLVSLIGRFLHVHPHGASVEYIWSYLNNLNPSVDCRYVENLLSRYPKLFRAVIRGVGAKDWVFIGYQQKK